MFVTIRYDTILCVRFKPVNMNHGILMRQSVCRTPQVAGSAPSGLGKNLIRLTPAWAALTAGAAG